MIVQGDAVAAKCRGKAVDTDIVFVVDKSESSEKESALSMLDAIRNQIDKGTKVNVGVVTFRHSCNAKWLL